MSNFINVGQLVYNQAIDENSTTQNAPLGTVIRARDTASTAYGEGEFIYLQGVASTAVGSVVLYNQDDYSTSLATSDDKGSIAIAMSASVANEYGWYQIAGKGVAKVLASFADNADCYLTGTAGSIDDAAVAGDFIYGMKGASAIGTPSAGLAEVEINYPSVKDAADVSLADLGVTASAADLNTTNVATAGTVEASKLVLVDSNKHQDVLNTTTLSIGASGSATAVTATAAEINQYCDESANTEIVTTTNVLTASESGKTLILNSATAFVTTLPAVAAGLRFNFYCGATGVTGGNHTIVPNASNDDTIYGSVEVAGAVVAASAEGSINLIADKFIAGDHISLFCDGTNWYVQGSVVTTAGLTFTT